MRVEGYIEGISEDGLGILKAEKSVYVPYTVTGDFVKVYRTRRRFGRVIARDFDITELSMLRQSPRCRHFGECGGCLWQHIKYGEQLKLKREIFARITGIDAEIRGSPRIWGFRNVSNFSVTTLGIGFKKYGRSLSAVDVRECPIFSKRTPRYLEALRGFLAETGLRPWSLRKKAGEVRYLQVREGKFTGEVMVNLVAHVEPSGKVLDAFKDYFSFAHSLYWSMKRDERDDPRGEAELIAGEPYIRERIGDATYLIHPKGFFQTNSYALPLLLKAVESFTDGERVLDLYSGVGTFSVWLGKRGFKVEGVELNPFAVEMANRNAELNGVDAVFKVGRAEETLIGDYDTVIADPPRKGLKEAAELLVRSGAEWIVYVSCNPRAFRLDYERHLKKAYRLENAVLIDMFPHTPHVEAVVELVRKV